MKYIAVLLLLFGYLTPADAQDENGVIDIPAPKVFTSEQEVTINEQTYSFDTRCGQHLLRDENDEPIALFGYTSYSLKNGTNRPIVFAFNGGPLSASLWLHMGILGPKRVVINDPDYTPAAPYELVNNEYSILGDADLVMIDPVGVGLSEPVGKAKWTDFWGVDQDVRSIALFIEQFLIANGRLNDPKYLLGESYGTFRNAYLMKYLQDKGIAMNGVIMVSAVFDLTSLLFGPDDDHPYLVHFPTYAATSRYHDLIDDRHDNLYEFLDEVRAFTENEYAPALLKGDRLSDREKRAMADKLSAYTGIDAEYWYLANLRVKANEYFAEALRKRGKNVGRLDSRWTGFLRDKLSQTNNSDPQASAISPPYITAMKEYLYEDLGVDRNLTYTTGAYNREGFKWDWKHEGNISWNAQVGVSTLEDMAVAMSRDPNVKVLILNGIFDLATVFYGVEHSVNHMDLPVELRDNIIMKYYEAGHMMYTHKPSMIKFQADVSHFIRETSNGG